MSIAADEVRKIEVDAPPTRFARGWHCLGLAKDFQDGKPHQIQAFGEKLVIWSDSQGMLNVIDAYCRHMGGDLSQGNVKGDEIACPFHDWRWGGDGRCKSIPYSRRVPLRARTSTWPTLVQDGMFFVWNDPEGNPPTEDAAIPRIEQYGSPDYTEWVWYKTTITNTNCREIIDNIVDMAHFFYIHYSFPIYFKNVFEGQVANQFMRSESRGDMAMERPDGAPEQIGGYSDASYFGPSFMIDKLVSNYESFDTTNFLINCHYPINENSFVLQYGVIVQKMPGTDDATALATAHMMGEFIRLGFEQDVEIWKNKTRIDNPLLCEEDGPVYQLRRWYEQFYVDVADIKPEMVERFEHELDTTMPNESWRAEVAENLARREADAQGPTV